MSIKNSSYFECHHPSLYEEPIMEDQDYAIESEQDRQVAIQWIQIQFIKHPDTFPLNWNKPEINQSAKIDFEAVMRCKDRPRELNEWCDMYLNDYCWQQLQKVIRKKQAKQLKKLRKQQRQKDKAIAKINRHLTALSELNGMTLFEVIEEYF